MHTSNSKSHSLGCSGGFNVLVFLASPYLQGVKVNSRRQRKLQAEKGGPGESGQKDTGICYPATGPTQGLFLALWHFFHSRQRGAMPEGCHPTEWISSVFESQLFPQQSANLSSSCPFLWLPGSPGMTLQSCPDLK